MENSKTELQTSANTPLSQEKLFCAILCGENKTTSNWTILKLYHLQAQNKKCTWGFSRQGMFLAEYTPIPSGPSLNSTP